jgi:hypothetical protein
VWKCVMKWVCNENFGWKKRKRKKKKMKVKGRKKRTNKVVLSSIRFHSFFIFPSWRRKSFTETPREEIIEGDLRRSAGRETEIWEWKEREIEREDDWRRNGERVSWSGQLGTVPKQIRVADHRRSATQSGDEYAETAFSLLPSPRALPLPSFSKKKQSTDWALNRGFDLSGLFSDFWKYVEKESHRERLKPISSIKKFWMSSDFTLPYVNFLFWFFVVGAANDAATTIVVFVLLMTIMLHGFWTDFVLVFGGVFGWSIRVVCEHWKGICLVFEETTKREVLPLSILLFQETSSLNFLLVYMPMLGVWQQLGSRNELVGWIIARENWRIVL